MHGSEGGEAWETVSFRPLSRGATCLDLGCGESRRQEPVFPQERTVLMVSRCALCLSGRTLRSIACLAVLVAGVHAGDTPESGEVEIAATVDTTTAGAGGTGGSTETVEVVGTIETGDPGAERVEIEIIATISSETRVPGDGDGDGTVGFDDLFLFAAAFGQPAGGDNAVFDFDEDVDIDLDDLALFLQQFGHGIAEKAGEAQKPTVEDSP